MTENNSNPTPVDATPSEETVVELNRFQQFALNHPRAAKATVITTSTIAAVGVGVIANTVRKNKRHLDSAAEHVSEAATELSNAVSPSSETDA